MEPAKGGKTVETLSTNGREAPINVCHDIIGHGGIGLCQYYIASGECSCCKFSHGNWIGTVPGERAILNKGDTAGWTDYKDGMQCHRDPAACNNKPLDCKMYPFFPYEVVDEGDQYRVYVGAADRCAAKNFITSALKGKVIRKGSTLSGEHLYLVGRVGVVLYEARLSEWMKETYRLSPGSEGGYNDCYEVVVNKDDV